MNEMRDYDNRDYRDMDSRNYRDNYRDYDNRYYIITGIMIIDIMMKWNIVL